MNRISKLFFLLSLIIFAVNLADAKIYRLNNSNSIPSDFKDITSAMKEIKSGDTLYVEGSNQNYGNLIIDKQVIIIGTGYSLAENNISNINTMSSEFSNLQINPNSDGAKIISIVFRSDSSSNQDVRIRSNNITIRNCLFKRNLDIELDSNISNLAFLQNYTTESIKAISTAILDNIYIANNIVLQSIKFSTKSNVKITNNIVRKVISANNSQITNNIQLDSNYTKTFTAGFSGSGNIYKSNITNNLEKYIPTAEGNLLGIKMTDIFEYYDNDFSEIKDTIWVLKANSPAIKYGIDGTDCGIFGGSTPYRISGIPPIPIIKDIIIDNSNENKDYIKVKIRVK